MTEDYLELNSPAKINWLLHVGAKRPDGYHDLVTLFQELELSEKMRFRILHKEECRLSGYPPDISAESNLVTRAWQLMRQEFPGRIAGLDVQVDKSLPQGGGLAGGSSNCAAALKAINILNNLELTDDKLQELGSRLGSDVPFFIRGGLALGRGRGEILEPLPSPPSYHLVLIMPPERMSTSEAFRLLDSVQRVSLSPHTMFHFLTELQSGEINRLARVVKNDFEFVAEKYDWFIRARQNLLDAGAIKVLLCGSGSTVAGFGRDLDHVQQIALQCGGIVSRTVGP